MLLMAAHYITSSRIVAREFCPSRMRKRWLEGTLAGTLLGAALNGRFRLASWRRIGRWRADAVARELNRDIGPDRPGRPDISVAAGKVLLPALGHTAPIERRYLVSIDAQCCVIVGNRLVVATGLRCTERRLSSA